MISSSKRTSTTFNEETKIWRGAIVQPIFGTQESIGSVVISSLLKEPDNIAQICYPSGRQYTNREIADLSIRVALNLRKYDLSQTEAIGICAANSDFVAPLVFGALLCGLSISTLDPTFDKTGIAHLFNITRPKLMFCDGEIYDKVKNALEEIGLADTTIYTISNHIANVPTCIELLSSCEGEKDFKFPVLQFGGNQVAMILCSSGTTGLPKAVTLSHASILNSLKSTIPKTCIWLCFSTLHWYTGLSALIHVTIYGNTRVISNRPFSPDDFIDIVERYKVNVVIGVLSQIAMTVASKRIHKCNLSSIALYMTGGTAVPYKLVRKFQNYVRNAKFYIYYGMTETCGSISYDEINPKDSVGQLRDNIEVKIIDEEGKSLNKNESGEICIRTVWMWSGYYNDSEATKQIYDEDRWIHSGDIGYFDSDGFLYVMDRKKDILKYNNYHFYPNEIEKIIMELPDVLEVCVVGIPDITFTHLPAAAVVKCGQSRLSEQEVVCHVAKRMQHFEQLHGGVYFLDSLPYTVSGKPLRRIISEICQNKRGKVDYVGNFS